MTVSAPTYGALNYDFDYDLLRWVPSQQAVVRADTLNVTLPATAATAANQTTGNTSLASIDTKTLARSSTATTTLVADTAVSTQLLAANTARLGASVTNDSSALLYLKLGTTASATDYSAPLMKNGYFETPYGYTGRIDGIWASDPNDGAARITELT